MTLIGIVSGVGLGVFLSKWFSNRQKASRLRMPSSWPLVARGLVTASENEVWTWLRSTFPAHLVLVKVPVLRFTVPMDAERTHSAQWLDRLGGVYTTFTVCTEDGTVVGCVDVPGIRGLGRTKRQLKESLLSACNIAYTVVRSTNLPAREAMRAAFLGEIADDFRIDIPPQQARDDNLDAELAALHQIRLRDSKAALQRSISQQADESGRPTLLPEEGMQSSRMPADWDHSFVANAPDPRPARPE